MPYLRCLSLGTLAVASTVPELVVFRAADELAGDSRQPGALTYDPPR